MCTQIRRDQQQENWRDHVPKAWLDRVLYAVCVFAAYLSVVSVPIGYAGAVVAALLPWFRSFATWILIAPVVLDLTSIYMHVAYIFGRTREHGISGLSLFYYIPYCLMGLGVPWWARGLLLGGFTAFHFACHAWIPRWVAIRMGCRPE